MRQTVKTATPEAGFPAMLQWCALALLCSAYVQGGLQKLFNFAGAVAEMQHFQLPMPTLLAAAVIVAELGAAAMILSGRLRWFGAAFLAVFTVLASLVANAFWNMNGMERQFAENGFFEHLGLAGAFVLVAWHDWQRNSDGR